MKEEFHLPAGWRRVAVGDYAQVIFSNVDKKSCEGEKPIRLCNYTDVYYSDYIESGDGFMEATATDAEIVKFSLRRGDVIITKDSEESRDIGVPAMVTKDLPNVLCGYHLAIVRPTSGLIDGAFLSQALRSHYMRKQLYRHANGVTRFGLSVDAIQELQIAMPPFAEQKSLGEMLGKWDKALQCVEVLCERKRDVRYAMTHKLLSGKVRFNGYQNNGWQHLHLGDIVTYEPRIKVKPTGQFLAAGVRSHGKGVFLKKDFDAEDIALDELYCLRTGDLVVNITFGWEGAVAIVPPEADGALVSHRFPTFTFKKGVSFPEYFRHVIRQKRFVHEMGLASPGGAGRNRVLSKRDFLRIPLELPCYEEQLRIAAVLNGCDREIELLERQQDALRTEKSGLMQKLLTGELRLKPPKGKRR